MERKENKALNDVRLGQNTRVRNVIIYCNSIIKENNFRELHFSAVGGAIGKLVSTVEVLRIVNPGFFQINKIGTVSYQTVDGQGAVTNQRLYPKLEVTLTLDEPKEKDEGFQAALTEEERLALFELHSKRGGEEERPQGRGRGGPRGAPRGRGGFRGGFRGEYRGEYRDEYRGDREDFRGDRNAPRERGGFSRGGPRGGFSRGGPRGGFRGSRGGPRGGFRGSRGGPRGGFRGDNRERTDSFNRGPRMNRGRGRGTY